jgi:hypothetical protein
VTKCVIETEQFFRITVFTISKVLKRNFSLFQCLLFLDRNKTCVQQKKKEICLEEKSRFDRLLSFRILHSVGSSESSSITKLHRKLSWNEMQIRSQLFIGKCYQFRAKVQLKPFDSFQPDRTSHNSVICSNF